MYGQRTTPDLTEVRSLQIDSRQKTAPRTRTMICASTSYFHASPSREAVVQGLPARRRTYPRKHVGDHAKYTTPHPRTRTTSALKHLDPVNVEIDALSVRGGVCLNTCKKKNERKKRGATRKPATLCSHAKTSSHLELFGTPGMDTRTMDTVVFFLFWTVYGQGGRPAVLVRTTWDRHVPVPHGPFSTIVTRDARRKHPSNITRLARRGDRNPQLPIFDRNTLHSEVHSAPRGL